MAIFTDTCTPSVSNSLMLLLIPSRSPPCFPRNLCTPQIEQQQGMESFRARDLGDGLPDSKAGYSSSHCQISVELLNVFEL